MKTLSSIALKLASAGALCFMMFCFSCSKDEEVLSDDDRIIRKYTTLTSSPFNYRPELPSFFNSHFIRIQDNTPADNPVTDWGATLGRVLFYDRQLSQNYSTSCASCHVQQFGFTDTARFSKGLHGGRTKRSSMSLLNARYYISGRFFWDERAATLEEQVLQPIQDKVEMGLSIDSLENRLRQTELYPALFRKAFGSPDIDRKKISKALAQFVRSMVSYRSKFDEGRSKVNSKDEDFPNFSAEENLGKSIFMGNKQVNCSGCHTTEAFIMDNPRNNGISVDNPDAGIYVHTGNSLDIGKFKAPSLKNIGLRKHFMHDGRLHSLEEVIVHYSTGIQANPNLDTHLFDMNNGKPFAMNLSADEVRALKAFLLTLTDEEIIRDEKFSSPFRH